MDKVLDVTNVCCLILLFVLSCFRNFDWSHESNAAVLTPLGYSRWRQYFCSYTFFFEKSLNFRGFSISSSFDRHLCQNWMSGVGTLCANAYYRASLLSSKSVAIKSNIIYYAIWTMVELFWLNVNNLTLNLTIFLNCTLATTLNEKSM